MNDTTVKGNKAILAANMAAIKEPFPKQSIKKELKSLAKSVTARDGAKVAMDEVGKVCVISAQEWGGNAIGNTNGQTTDRYVAAQCWLNNLRATLKSLPVEDNPIMELSTPKDPKKAGVPRLTGYGRNISSATSGVVEFNIDCAGKTFNAVYKEVKAERKLRNPNSLRDAKEALTEALVRLRKRSDPELDHTKALTGIVDFLNESIETDGMIVLQAIGLGLEEMGIEHYLDAVTPDTEEEEQETTSDDVEVKTA